MADVLDSFLRGHAAGQNEIAHQQAMEQNRLQAMVLKHHLDALKIDDEVRKRDIALQNASLLHGQPAADLPSEPAGIGGPQTSAITPPASIAAPEGTDVTVPQTPSMLMRPQAVQIPGAAGVPGVSIRPQSMEDIVRATTAAKLAEPYTLPEGSSRMVGGDVVAQAPRKLTPVGAGGLYDPEHDKLVAPGRAPAIRPVAGMINGKPAFATFDPRDGTYTIGGRDVTERFAPMPRAGDDAATKAEKQDTARRFREYTISLTQKMKDHAAALKAANDHNLLYPEKPVEVPEWNQPTFEDFLASQPTTPTGAPAGAAAAGGTAAAAPRYTVGQRVRLKNGRTAKITAVHPDGSFDVGQR